VYAHAESARLVETVRSLQADGGDGAEIVPLSDGPDAALSVTITNEPALAISRRHGRAAWVPPRVSTGWHRALTRRLWSGTVPPQSSRAGSSSTR
jgi:hypothetical protein